MNIAGVEIGPGQPCRIVAEISNNHNGSLELAKRLIHECAHAGADFVKFQCYTPDELVRLRGDGPAPDPWGADGWTMRDLYEKAQTPHAWFPELVAECDRAGVAWFSSVFGWESLDLLLELDCPAFKFAALDVDTHFVAHAADMVRRLGKPVLASSRGGRLWWADTTLYCPEGYPQDWGPWGLDWLLHSGYLNGISYHGTDVSWLACLTTYGSGGADLVECHVQLDDIASELESGVSLTVSQLRELCR